MSKVERIPLLNKPLSDAQVENLRDAISKLYNDPKRVIYEYIQNSLDSAIEMQKKYNIQKNFIVYVHIDSIGRQIVIQDNCEGMTGDFLKTLPSKMFEPRKKSFPWLVGQFGYGIHSFMAWFDEMEIISQPYSSTDCFSLTIKRDKRDTYWKPSKLLPFGKIYPTKLFYYEMKRFHGTDVVLKGFRGRGRKKSFDFIREALFREIPVHFEEYIKRERAEIVCIEWIRHKGRIIGRAIPIEPLMYEDFEGAELKGNIEINGKVLGKYYFKIVDPKYVKKYPQLKNYIPRLMQLGTRVSEIPRLKSFVEFMESKDLDFGYWERAEVVGYVDVSKELELTISRTDLAPSNLREMLYHKLVDIGDEIKKKIDEITKLLVNGRDIEGKICEICRELRFSYNGKHYF